MIDRKRVILYIMSCVQQEHKTIRNARVAQLVERDLAKVEAAGSSPVSRFFYFRNFAECKVPFLFLPMQRKLEALHKAVYISTETVLA